MLGPSAVTVPYGADETLYLVVDRISATKDVRIERIDLEATISDLIAGCFSEPLRVQAFNTLEHWVKDISADVAIEIQSRCDIDGVALPEHLRDFVESHLDCGHSLVGRNARDQLRHCERSEAIQTASAEGHWIASSLRSSQ